MQGIHDAENMVLCTTQRAMKGMAFILIPFSTLSSSEFVYKGDFSFTNHKSPPPPKRKASKRRMRQRERCCRYFSLEKAADPVSIMLVFSGSYSPEQP